MPVEKIRVVFPSSRDPSLASPSDSHSRTISSIISSSCNLPSSPTLHSSTCPGRRSSALPDLDHTEAQSPEQQPLHTLDSFPETNSAMDDLHAVPDDALLITDAVDGTPKPTKNDEFYKHWDRFLRVKEKEKSKLKGKGKRRGIAAVEGKSRTSSTSGTGRIPDQAPVFVHGQRQTAGPSLDRDVEGRPGHPMVRSNTEGVISR